MKDKEYSLLELQKLYATFLRETGDEEADDCIYNLLFRDFVTWLRKREASTPDFKPIEVACSVKIDREYIRKELISDIIAALKGIYPKEQ